jgi:hypothetical protein
VKRLLDSLIEELSSRWKSPDVPRTRRPFRCTCGRPVFFLNSQCLGCNAPLGYAPLLGELRALQAGVAADTWQLAGDNAPQGDYRRCANFDSPAGCNWLVAVDDPSPLCISCRLNRTIPDLRDNDNRDYWKAIEAAKRQLVSQLLALGLPVESRTENREQGLAFDILRTPAGGPKVVTGHDRGVITLDAEEADDANREQVRTALAEPYRTLLGHLRHEIGHYYWDRVVWNTAWLEPFRALFGDERADYAAALQSNYENGPPADWTNRHISAYASAHPWEDWAETWAHYLHIVASLRTAITHGLDGADLDLQIEPFTRDDLYDPGDPNADRALFLLNSWVEMITVLNEMARSLGEPDFYPFVMPRTVVRKLHFVHLVVAGASG